MPPPRKIPCKVLKAMLEQKIINYLEAQKLIRGGHVHRCHDVVAAPRRGRWVKRGHGYGQSMNGVNPFAVCKAAQKRHGFGKKKLERCIRAVKSRRSR